MRRANALRKDIIAKTAYPIAIFVMILLTVIFLSFFVLPQFEAIFQDADRPPPLETQIVIAIGSWLRSWIGVLPAASLLLLALVRAWYHRNKEGVEDFLFRMPIIGFGLKRVEAVRYCESLGTLLAGGAIMSKSLAIAQKTVNSTVLSRRLEALGDEVRAGASLSVSLEKADVFPTTITNFVRIGEETGELGRMLMAGANVCQQDIKSDLTKFTNLIGPVMTALMGLITAGVIASIMSGVLSLNETIR